MHAFNPHTSILLDTLHATSIPALKLFLNIRGYLISARVGLPERDTS